MKNYCKATKGDITCAQCGNHVEPDEYNKRIRCRTHWHPILGYIAGYSVGKTMTCNNAFIPNFTCSVCGIKFDAHVGETECRVCRSKKVKP